MKPEDRIAVIQECIAYIKERPGRKAITSLEAMLGLEKAKVTKPAKDHPWRNLAIGKGKP